MVLSRTRDLLFSTIPLAWRGDNFDVNAPAFTPDGDTFIAQLQRLGRDKWELVTVLPIASQHNSPLTTEQHWVFKRPIE